MLEVFLLQQYNIVKLHICLLLRLQNDLYCVEWGVKLYSLTFVSIKYLYASRNARSANNLGDGQIFECNAVFVHIKYTSNMATFCVSDVNDITSPHV